MVSKAACVLAMLVHLPIRHQIGAVVEGLHGALAINELGFVDGVERQHALTVFVGAIVVSGAT